MFKKIVAAAALTLVASSSFAAAPIAFYGGLDAGSTKIDDFGSSKGSFGGFVGYGFNQFFAVEAGYRHLGTYDFDVVANNRLYSGDVKAKQTHLSLIGSYPLNEALDVYGRLGYNKLRAKATVMGVSGGADDSTGLYGIGLNYTFAPNFSGRIEAQKPSSDSRNISASVVWQFR
ncbi:outer membrane beta-barrel protein [Massilia forsythiae]|uniref:Outer membrane beta-barrel protein n=1 Tax=Massilia forsythiae TaxID=2728020 RepID=A0A7Z2ZRM3_9BURK|nr:outer membrane beta-barrel protein [Massilia forsythiae]QJD99318.1 outer membrane beta-barrel protein [Massilia forsythiae]